jgi:acyl carrier protein
MISDDRRTRIKAIIVDRLNLTVDPATIADDALLFAPTDEGGLGLDSVDALELAVALNAEFDVEIGDEDMSIFQSVATMADFVDTHAPTV